MIPSIVCFGDNCIDQYDYPTKRQFVGGNALNTAVHAKEAGCKTSYVGSIGKDANGRAVLDKLRKKGIDVSHVQAFNAETAWTKVSLKGGERQFLEEYLGPQEQFQLTDEVLNYLFQHTIIHNTWQGGTEHKLPVFKSHGNSLLSMDFGERYPQEFLDTCIPYIDIAFFSMDPDKADRARNFAHSMHARGPKYVVVTMGRSGSIVLCNDDQFYFAPAKTIKVVDTLGAGDTYIGTLLAAFVAQKPVPECMELATAAAAKTCSFFSGFEGSEILDQV